MTWKNERQRHSLASRGITSREHTKLNKQTDVLLKQSRKFVKSYETIDEVSMVIGRMLQNENLTIGEKEELINMKFDLIAIRDNLDDNRKNIDKIKSTIYDFMVLQHLKSKLVYVGNDRLYVDNMHFANRAYSDDARWMLVDKRGNSYGIGTPLELIQQIDERVRKGDYKLG